MSYFATLVAILAALSSTSVFRMSSATCTEQACFPPTRDLTEVAGVSIGANSTCGETRVENFCVKQVCTHKCDATVPSLFHGANLTIDKFNLNSYWKSKNLDENVVLQLDLGHSYFFSQIFVTFSFQYPAAMYIAKSDDNGATWKTMRYLSTDCTKYFKMTAVEDNNQNGFAVECIRLDTRALTVGEDPKASYSPWRDPKFSSSITTNHTLQREFLATNFRVVLVKFITPVGYNPDTADSRNFFFAVKDWEIGGHCYCHGFSDVCNAQESWKCNCLKNATGDNCEKCRPLFNNRKYEEGKSCEECECHNHSSSCSFNETKGHGVCQDCTGSTTGDFCEKCLPKYYNAHVSLEHPERCQPCNCHPSGITTRPNSERCNQTSGQCDCKPKVTGRTCDQCMDGYWNLTKANPDGCQICVCELAGTTNGSNVCDKKTGQCPCRDTIGGIRCTRCKDGYFGLTNVNPSRCKDCSCSIVGSHNITCDQDTGHCYCRKNFDNANCSSLAVRHYVPGVQEMTYKAQKAGAILFYNDTSGVSGVVIDGLSDSRSVSFNIDIPKTSLYAIIIRYQTAINWNNVVLKVESLAVPFQPYSCDGIDYVSNRTFTLNASLERTSDAVNFGDTCMAEGSYRITLEIPLVTSRGMATSKTVVVDSCVILPSIKNLKNPPADNQTYHHYQQAMSYSTWSRNQDEIQQSLAPLYSYAYDGGKACFCNTTGSFSMPSCNRNGGKCNCTPNVDGLKCDRCKPTYYNFSQTGCQACNCDPLGSIDLFCHQFTGQCKCKPGVIGKHCDRCETNHYGLKRGNGCSPCGCHQNYSTNLQCDDNGVCSCLPGVNGKTCSNCNDTSFNLTSKGCDPCNCDVDGSESLTCNKTTGNCTCKPMATGKKCDSCPFGYYYGLSKYHPSGCLKCYCSGKSVNCSSKDNMYETSIATDLDVLHGQNPALLDGWNTSIPRDSKIDVDFDFFPGLRGVIKLTLEKDSDAYYEAPSKYLGDKRNAYQHNMSFYLWLENNSSDPYSSPEGDVILNGKWFNETLVYQLDKRPTTERTMYTIFFGEGHWKVGHVAGRNAYSHELIAVLGDLKQLKIRARWTESVKGHPTYLAMVKMYLSKEYLNKSLIPSGARMSKSVEKCNCPPEFAGDSCQRCASGYTRKVPNSGPDGSCVPCSCNGNSDKCESETGVCLDCKHNTTGNHCEKCAFGYYGNASLGTPEACRPCQCYGGDLSCKPAANGSFVCDCPTGYQGRRCEECTDGYHGTPTEPNGVCTKCECNGNSDVCDKRTGSCSSFCRSNTTGPKCEWCAEGFYGKATQQSCKECICTELGSVNKICDRTTGNCPCRANVEGKSCSRCSKNSWGFESGTGCTFCNCSIHGATVLQCNLTTGICSCKENATGTMCDKCIPGLYDVSKGCPECQCNMTYSNDTICNPYSGQCSCKKSSEGGFFGGRQCTECRWDAVGTFPSCAQCNETCYENWYGLIEKERHKVADLAKNVSGLLKTFNDSTVDVINQTLSDLNSKLNKSEWIFNGAQYSTKEREKRFKKINESMVDLLEKLNQANRSLTEIQYNLTHVIAPYDGTVNITSEKPPVLANYTFIRAWAERILREVESYNRTAYQNYQSIMSDYEEIIGYNKSGAEAVEQVRRSMERLDKVENKTKEIDSLLGEKFYKDIEENNRILEQLRKDSEDISRLVNQSSELSRNATKMLDYAQENLNAASDNANKNLEKGGKVYNNSLETRKEAHEAMNASAEFKMNSTAMLTKVENAIKDLKEGIDDMALAKENTDNATKIAESVLAMSIPVEEKTIRDLSSKILNITVNETLVNATFKDATAGLEIAEKAQRNSERVKNISEETLSKVKEIEMKMKQAEEYRVNATKLQNASDDMVKEITKTTSEIEKEFSAASKIGNETLALIDTTIAKIDGSLKCFNESHEAAVNASNMANLAYRQIMNASKIQNDTKTKLSAIEPDLNKTYQIAMESHRDIVETNKNATELYEQIKEAEDILKSYIQQRDEMDDLKKEIADLEKRVDELNKDLEAKLIEYESCGND